VRSGFAATLIDTVGSAALATINDKSSVSTHISSEYLLGLPVGDVAIVDATVLSSGGRLSNIEVLAASAFCCSAQKCMLTWGVLAIYLSIKAHLVILAPELAHGTTDFEQCR
jgi:acyl-coenzyme A thioesterase PaaI-like protein